MRGTNTSQKDTKGTAARPGQQQTSKQQQQFPQQQQQQAKQVPAKQVQQQQVKSQQNKVDQPQIIKQTRPAAEQQMPMKQVQQKVQQQQMTKETQMHVQHQSLRENQQKAQQQSIKPQSQQSKSESIQPLQKRPLGQVQPEQIVIRIYSKSGRSRIEIMNNATFQELQKQVEQRLNVPIKDQSYQLENKNPLRIRDAAEYTLVQLGLKNGDILHLTNENVVVPNSANVNIQKPSGNELIENIVPVQLSSQSSVKEAKQQTEYKSSCSHGPGGKCINCLTKEEKKEKEEIKVEPGQKLQKSWLCNHAIGGKCVHCLEDQFISNAKHISFEKFIKDKQAKCQQHPKQSKCPNCLPPSEVSFKVNMSCTKHKP